MNRLHRRKGRAKMEDGNRSYSDTVLISFPRETNFLLDSEFEVGTRHFADADHKGRHP
jgi:hypothetical protein